MSKLPRQKSSPRHFIRAWRMHRKMTQDALAEKIGVTSGAISQLENGLINYTQPTLEAIARALECSPADLLYGPPAKTEDEAERRLSVALREFGVHPQEIGTLVRLIRGAVENAAGSQIQTDPHDQSAPATPRRARVT